MQKLRIRRSLFVLLLVSLTIITASGQENSPQIDATLQDALLVDRDGDGLLDAGDTLGYTLEITNCGTVPAENVQITGQVDPNTRFSANSVQVNAPRPATNCPPQPNPTSPVAVVSADGPLVVQATAPANGATQVAPNTSIVLQFNRTVAVAGDWFTLVCTASGTFSPSAGNVILTSDGITLVLDPVLDLVPGETCTVTVFAANVSGSDPNAPGLPMAADYVFSFTTATTETPPTITATTPVNGEAAFVSTGDIVITFSEPVTVSETSFTLECPSGTPVATGFVVTGSGTNIVTINPNDNLPSGVTCTVVVIAANVSDTDAIDPPNLLDGNGDTVEGDNYTFSFSTTSDAAPTVQAITPANGASGVLNTTPITVVFSESVDIASPAAFALECPVATPIAFSVTTPAALPASATTYILTPTSALPDGVPCTVTVIASQVADTDLNEPPNNMAADFSATFTTEAPPSVTTTNPANGATGIATTSSIVIDFSEPVDVSTSSFTIECPAGGTSYTFTIAGSGGSSIILSPDTLLPAGETCTVTVIAPQVSDTDVIDPPNTMAANTSFSFTTAVDAAPTVQTISPANGASGVPINTTITIDFSESVDISSPAAFGLECPLTTPIPFTVTTPAALPASGTTYILTPNSALPIGRPCTVTVFAAQVTDTDLDEPPNNMAADFTATFTTEAPPTITTTSPANGATTVAGTTDIVVTFDEPVSVTAASFTLECPGGTPFAGGFAVSGSGTSTITINPTGSLPAGANCAVRAIAAQISDVDANDPPDLLDGNADTVEGDDYLFSFTTDVDAAPSVLSITPANGATDVPSSTNITIDFSELVDIPSAAAFSLVCEGNPQGYTVITPATLPASTTTVVIDPTSFLPDASACTVIVFAASVTDSDTDEPPDNMAADFTATFTTEAPPSVTGTTPADGATGVSTGTNIVLTFSEPVDVSGPSFIMFCGVIPIITSNSGTGTNTITLDPVINLPTNTVCTVNVVASQVTDSDLVDPPDQMLVDYPFSFTTLNDTAPVASSPLDGATNVATASNIVINFNEPVDVVDLPTAAFALECPVGTPIAFTTIPSLPTTNQSSITIDPNVPLPATTTCRVTVESNNVTDTDTDEPPDNMTADYIFTFNTVVDLAPTVDQPNIIPASTSGGPNTATIANPVSTTPTITIPFSEAVDAASGALTLTCNASSITISASPALPALGQTSLDVSPDAPLTPGANCVLTVVAANISDSDPDDPPNLMVTNFTLTFSVDTAPAETLTQTEVGDVFQNVTGAGANNVDLDTNIQISFTEAVTVTFPANGLQCPAGNNIPVTVTTNNAATIVLNPNANLPLNTACVLNIPAANISDVDTADAPDTPASAVSHTFTTVDDDAPTVTTNPASGGGNIAVNSNITVTFNEAVTLTGAWFDLTCSISGNRVSTGELTGTGINIIENTPDLVYTIDPTVDLAAGDVCTITIDSANVVDNDAIDPPNQLDGDASLDVVDGDADDYVAVFSTVDTAPRVNSTTPLAAASVGSGQTVTLNFSEAVDIAAGAFTFECPAGSPITGGFNTSVPLPANAVTSITLTPVNPLPVGAACVVTVDSSLVVDLDPVDPPNFLDGDSSGDLIDDADNFFLNFTVDAQATEVLTEAETAGVFGNIAGAVNIDLDSNIRITFSEAVTVGLTSFDLECPAGSDITFTVSGSGTNVITVDPTVATLPINTLCDFDIIAANVTDVDTNDPPDVLDANVNYTFTTVNDNPPSVTSAEAEVANTFTTLPLGAGVFADTDTNLRVTFNEAVTVAGNWAELNCTLSGIQDDTAGLTVVDADPVFTLNPSTNLVEGENCTLTIFAAQVNDDDAIDPPSVMLADAVFTFTVTDTPPQVNAGTTTPANGATVPNNQTVTINFTEMVDIAAGGITWQCGVTNITFTPALPQNNVTSITLTPTSTLPAGSCTVTLESTLITDDDTADPPNELDGNASNDTTDGDADDFTRTFTVDAPPAPFSVTVEVAGVPTFLPLGGGQVVDVDSNILVQFSEPIDATVAGITLECPAGSPVTFAGLPVANSTSVTLNPSANLPGNTLCALVLVHTGITDTDTFDPPNQLDGNGNGTEGDSIGFIFTTQSVAADDGYTITPHLTFTSPTGVRVNDAPATVTITGFGPTLGTANGTAPNGTSFITAGGAGGRVVMNADGTFIFYPDAGDTSASGTATFFYTITGGDTAQVTLTFEAEELVWFADQFPPGSAVCTTTNTGTQACPAPDFASLIAPNLTTSDILFINSGAYQCGITLPNNVQVIGNSSSSTLTALAAAHSSPITPVAGSDFAPYNALNGTAPILNSAAGDCFTLGQGNTVRGLTVANTPTGHAFQDNGGTIGTATITEVSVNGSGGIFNLANGGTLNATLNTMTSSSSPSTPILLTNIAGTITQTGGGTITHTGNFDLMDVNGGSVGGSFNAAFNITGGSGSVVDVSGGHTGSLTFAGVVSSAAPYTGDNLQFDNADGAYTFSGETDLLAGSAGVNIQNGSGGTFSTTNTDSSIANITGISFRVNVSTMTINTALDITHTAQANRGVEMVTATGTTNFTGTLQLGTVGSPMLSAEGVFLDGTGAVNTITFSDLNIITGTGGGAGSQAFVSQTSGRIAVTTGSIDCNGNIGTDNHCFDVSNTNSNGVTFASFLSDHDDAGENGGGIFLNSTTGTFTFTNVPRMTGNNAAIIQASNFGTLNVGTGSTGNMETSNRPVWNLENGAVNLNATVLRSTNSPTEGIRLIGLSGTGVTTTGTINLDLSPSSPFGILMQNITAGAYNFSTANTVTIVDRPNEGIYLNNVDGGSVAFGNTTISNPGGTTEPAVRGENGSSSVTFAQANINQGNVGTHEGFTDEFTPQDNNGLGDAMYFETMTGGVTVNGGTITNVNDDGIDIRASQNLTLTNVTISNTGLSAGADCVGCNSAAVQAYELTGTNVMTNLNVSNGRIRNFYLSNTTGSTTLNVTTSTLNDTRSGGVGTDNLQVYLGGTASGAFNITNSTFTRSRTHQINVVTRGSSVVSELDITGNTIDYVDGPSSGIFIDALGSSSVNYNITSNARIHAYAENAITVAADNTAFVQGRINNHRDAAPAYVIRGYHPTGTIFVGIRVVAFNQARNVVLIDNNELQGFNIQDGIVLSVQDGSNARIDATITNNTIDADPAGIDGFPLDAVNGTLNTVAGSTKILCLDARSNTVTGEWLRAARLRMFSPTGALLTGFTTDFPTTWAANGNTVLGTIVGATSNGGTILGTASCNTVAHPVAALNAPITIAEAPTFDAPAAATVAMNDGMQLVDVLAEALWLGDQTAHAQGGSFNLPLGPISVGTIPAGSSVTITFAVPVNAVIPPGTSSVALQAIVSGSNFGSVLSDDPETAVNRDTTLTPLDSLQAVQTLPETGEDPWWQGVVIWGVRLGLLAFVLLALTAVRRRFFRAA